jgi:hypothetical protein
MDCPECGQNWNPKEIIETRNKVIVSITVKKNGVGKTKEER